MKKRTSFILRTLSLRGRKVVDNVNENWFCVTFAKTIIIKINQQNHFLQSSNLTRIEYRDSNEQDKRLTTKIEGPFVAVEVFLHYEKHCRA